MGEETSRDFCLGSEKHEQRRKKRQHQRNAAEARNYPLVHTPRTWPIHGTDVQRESPHDRSHADDDDTCDAEG